MKTVVIGMSGGVDSSVAAYLLKKDGYNVIGLFMRNWDSLKNNDVIGNPDFDNDICPQEIDYNDAIQVCKKLDIPLHRVDFIKEYWDYVFTYFLDELNLGRTPNPDLMCNKFIKFDLFIKHAKSLGADYIATGHYAKTKNSRLFRANDTSKDQSYFLAAVSKEQFKDVLFPLGNITKEKVRKIALELDLVTARKKDSTGICFIGERNYQKFIKNYLKPNPGNIIDVETKNIVGKHTGLMNYTIGQRRNVGLSGDAKRHYVVGKNVKDNILYIAYGEDSKYLMSDACLIDNLNIINKIDKKDLTAKFRYRGEDHIISIEYLDNNTALVKYPNLASSVTPGQACVLYDGEECLGSGIIKEVYKDSEKLWYIN